MFQCKDLLSLPSFSSVRVLAGKSGLENGIRWVYKPENMNFSKWVKGHELLIISSPVIQSEDFNLTVLIEKACQLQISGALLLTGEQYIKRIPKKLITYADNHQFPLFIMSGETPLINIFEEIGHAIAYHEGSEHNSEDLLSGIIFGNEIDIDALILKSHMIGYDITPPQQIFDLHVSLQGDMTSFDREMVYTTVKQSFEKEMISIVLSQYGNNFIGMFQSFPKAKEKLQQIYDAMCQEIRKKYPDIYLMMGVGKPYQRLEKLQDSFHEASRAIMLMHKKGYTDGIYFSDSLGFLNLLYNMEDTKSMEDFLQDTLGALLDYDRENNTELVKTLKVYLEQDCSLLHASEQLHTHRNTVKYRIQRVEEITGRSLQSFYTKLEFMNAILCYEMLKE